jgi:hypothetical protein
MCSSCKNRRTLRRNTRLLVTANVVPSSPFLSPWWRRHYVPPKHRFLQEPHDVTSQKTAFLLIILVIHGEEYNLWNSSLCMYGRRREADQQWFHGNIIVELCHLVWRGDMISQTSGLSRAIRCNAPDDIRPFVMQFSHPAVTSSLFGPTILLSTLFSNTPSLRSSLLCQRQSFALIQNHRQKQSCLF